MAAATLLTASPAWSATFDSHTLTGTGGYNLIGIDANGDVAIESSAGCTSNDPGNCYEIFSGGQLVSASDTLTGFTPDDGTACSFASPPGVQQIGQSVCNGGNQAVGVRTNGRDEIVFISYGVSNIVTIGTADLLFVDTAGDFVVTDGLNGEIREFTPTPEPGTLIMLVTATLATAALLYRRRRVR